MLLRKPRIVIVDYGMGNIQSVSNALERLGCHVYVSSDQHTIKEADALILPGVGAFGEAMGNLKQRNLVDPLRNAVLNEGKPLLGICLGMQLLADESEERGVNKGLSLIPGVVRRIPVPDGLMLPHIGWNEVSLMRPEPLFRDMQHGDAFYFVHSFRFECDSEYVSAVTNYGVDITAAIQKGRIYAVQFHPERSQRKGLRLLHNFIDYVKSAVPERVVQC